MFAEYLQNVQMPNLLPRFHFLKQIFVAQILVIYLSELQVVLYAICDGKEINDKVYDFLPTNCCCVDYHLYLF